MARSHRHPAAFVLPQYRHPPRIAIFPDLLGTPRAYRRPGLRPETYNPVNNHVIYKYITSSLSLTLCSSIQLAPSFDTPKCLPSVLCHLINTPWLSLGCLTKELARILLATSSRPELMRLIRHWMLDLQNEAQCASVIVLLKSAPNSVYQKNAMIPQIANIHARRARGSGWSVWGMFIISTS